MNARHRFALGFALALSVASAAAESLRCTGGIAAEGDSRLALVYKCGEPVARDSHCAPVYYRQTLNPVPEAVAVIAAPCVHTEEWLYERGPGRLLATVSLRGGRVQSISYGHAPR